MVGVASHQLLLVNVPDQNKYKSTDMSVTEWLPGI